jgi:hypothetical protein
VSKNDGMRNRIKQRNIRQPVLDPSKFLTELFSPVPGLTSEQFRFQFLFRSKSISRSDQGHIEQFSNKIEAALLFAKLSSNIYIFFTFVIPLVGSGMTSGVPLRQKVPVPAVPVPQQCFQRCHANLEREERVGKLEGLHAGPDHDPVGLVPLLGGGGAESSLHVNSEAGHLLGHLLAFSVLREKNPQFTILFMYTSTNVQYPPGTGYGSGS